MKQKLVLAWVDNTGIELTGRYRDRLRQHPEIRSIPQAMAACWGENTEKNLANLKDHIAKEAKDHEWMGYFLLNYTNDILPNAKKLALEAAKP